MDGFDWSGNGMDMAMGDMAGCRKGTDCESPANI